MQTLTPLVIKLGGGEGLDLECCCADIAALQTSRPLVIVHGVSAIMAQLSAERGMPVQMFTSPSGHNFRYTNPQVRDLYVEVCHRANQQIVSLLRAHGLQAIGQLSPIVIHGQRKSAIRALVNGRVCIVRDDYSGSIEEVNVAPLNHHLAAGVIPVVPPLADSIDGLLNVDGDRAGAAIVAALRAGEYVILSNVRGLYRNFDDSTTHIPTVTAHHIEDAMHWAQGRMKRKVLAAREALSAGVSRVIIADGRCEQPITRALQGEGTEFLA